MRAIRIHEHGGPEKLVLEEIAEPRANATEVLVKVKACALNHLDIWTRKGLPNVRIPLPIIPGSDISGEIAEAGNLVKDFRKGDPVIVSPGISCGGCYFCVNGEENLCRDYKIFGYMIDGGYAEYVCVPERNLVHKPENISYEEAAAIPLVSLTAWNMLVKKAKIKPGELVLVIGAGSGVGSVAIQIAKILGGIVIATAGSDEKLEKAASLGAQYLINHSKQDIYEEVKRITNKRGVDIIFEHAGEAVWEKCIMSLAIKGRLITCGATTGHLGKTDIRYLFSRQLSIIGSYMGTKADLMESLEFYKRGLLKAIVDRTFSLSEAAHAHRYLEDRNHFGKVILLP